MLELHFDSSKEFDDLSLNDKLHIQNVEYIIFDIKKGGMCRVLCLKTLHKTDSRKIGIPQTIAIKGLKKEYEANEKIKKVFISELVKWSKLNHPNTVPLFGLAERFLIRNGSSKNSFFGIMEYCECSLRELIAGKVYFENGKKEPIFPLLSWQKKIQIIINILDGLMYGFEAHKLLHLDIKPENILLKIERTKRADISNSKQQEEIEDIRITVHLSEWGIATVKNSCTTDSVVSRRNSFEEITNLERWGTLKYMSPERFQLEKKVTEKSDIFALALVISEIMHGKLPFFQDNNGKEKIPMNWDSDNYNFGMIHSHGTFPIHNIISSMLSYDQEKRYPYQKIYNSLTKFTHPQTTIFLSNKPKQKYKEFTLVPHLSYMVKVLFKDDIKTLESKHWGNIVVKTSSPSDEYLNCACKIFENGALDNYDKKQSRIDQKLKCALLTKLSEKLNNWNSLKVLGQSERIEKEVAFSILNISRFLNYAHGETLDENEVFTLLTNYVLPFIIEDKAPKKTEDGNIYAKYLLLFVMIVSGRTIEPQIINRFTVLFKEAHAGYGYGSALLLVGNEKNCWVGCFDWRFKMPYLILEFQNLPKNHDNNFLSLHSNYALFVSRVLPPKFRILLEKASHAEEENEMDDNQLDKILLEGQGLDSADEYKRTLCPLLELWEKIGTPYSKADVRYDSNIVEPSEKILLALGYPAINDGGPIISKRKNIGTIENIEESLHSLYVYASKIVGQFDSDCVE